EDVSVTLDRPFRLCVPASKNGEDPTAPQHPDHLLCYRTRSARFGDESHTIQNQFGQRDVRVISRNELCVPSQQNPGTTTTTSRTSSSTSPTTTTSTTSSMTTTTMASPSGAFIETEPSLFE